VLQAQINKADRNEARGMAQMMRAGLYRPVHVKTLRSQTANAADPSQAAAVQADRHADIFSIRRQVSKVQKRSITNFHLSQIRSFRGKTRIQEN
jgi:hypothetical protein